jgi:hypothetical protein
MFSRSLRLAIVLIGVGMPARATALVTFQPANEPGSGTSVDPSASNAGQQTKADETVELDDDARSASSQTEWVPGQGVPLASGVRLGAYVEAHWTYAFACPSNGIIAHRGFDNRHNTFTLSNAAFGVDVDRKRLHGSLWLQWGNTPASYYAGEPEQPLGGAVGESNAVLWRTLQEANFGLRSPLHRAVVLDVEAGLFTSPIGIESVPIDANWNWSRSNLFFGLPFYHTGVRANLLIEDAWRITAAVYNGWNTVVDNNREKSLSLAIAHASEVVEASLLYFSGVERDPDFDEGRPWRHLFDTWVLVHATSWLSFAGQLNGGFEPRENATHGWIAGAGYVRAAPLPWFDVALRGDGFREWAPQGETGERLDPIFWPSGWVASGTATVGFRPHQAVLVRVEYRHDHAAGPTYYQSLVLTDPNTGIGVLNARFQDTLTIGTVVRF